MQGQSAFELTMPLVPLRRLGRQIPLEHVRIKRNHAPDDTGVFDLQFDFTRASDGVYHLVCRVYHKVLRFGSGGSPLARPFRGWDTELVGRAGDE